MDNFGYLPQSIRQEAVSYGERLTGIRIRRDKSVQFETAGERILSATLNGLEFENTVLSMMGHSLYARQNELDMGYFTITDGSRVGVCGNYNTHGPRSVKDITSVYIRISREIPGCASEIIDTIAESHGTLIISPPGMGKTTILRDAARLLSENGSNVCIIDERGELAACSDSAVRMDVGNRTDVMTGCEKSRAIPFVIRSCAPDFIVTDEIGSEDDIHALSDAVRCGVRILASAHGYSVDKDKMRSGICKLVADGIFDTAILLGPDIGKIAEVRKFNK